MPAISANALVDAILTRSMSNDIEKRLVVFARQLAQHRDPVLLSANTSLQAMLFSRRVLHKNTTLPVEGGDHEDTGHFVAVHGQRHFEPHHIGHERGLFKYNLPGDLETTGAFLANTKIIIFLDRQQRLSRTPTIQTILARTDKKIILCSGGGPYLAHPQYFLYQLPYRNHNLIISSRLLHTKTLAQKIFFFSPFMTQTMDPKLARKASSLPLAKCTDLRRYDKEPLILSELARDFSAHFLKLANAYKVPMVASSSSKYPCCVEIRVPAQTEMDLDEKAPNEIRTALDKVTTGCGAFRSGCDVFLTGCVGFGVHRRA